MPWNPSILLRPHPGMLVVLGTSALGGAAYRFSTPNKTASDESMNAHIFTPWTIVDKQAVSSTCAIFTLRNQSATKDSQLLQEVWKNKVWSVQVKQPQLQIARAYTPLPPNTGSRLGSGEVEEHGQRQDLRLLIRREHGGEVSNYLHALPPNASLELRGPHTEVQLGEDVQEVLFLAGGTGIAPALQVAHALGKRQQARMAIMWASRRREECVGGVSDGVELDAKSGGWRSWLGFGNSAEQRSMSVHSQKPSRQEGLVVQELAALKRQNGRLSVDYFVDEEKSFIKPDQVMRHLSRRGTAEGGKKVILISGPDGFIEYWAGRKKWVDGSEQQGPLGGVLGRMNLNVWKVVKL